MAGLTVCTLLLGVLIFDLLPLVCSPRVGRWIVRVALASAVLTVLSGAVGLATRTRPGLIAAGIAALAVLAIIAMRFLP